MDPTNTSTTETSMDLDMIHEIVNQGFRAYCQSIDIPDGPPEVTRETIGWFVAHCTAAEFLHLAALVIGVGTRERPLESCARYALERSEDSGLQDTERAIFDVLLDALQRRGHEPAEIALMLDSLTRPLEYLVSLAEHSMQPAGVQVAHRPSPERPKLRVVD